MNAQTALTNTANLFLALGDPTRLRLLNLLRENEVCVSSFTQILRHSQPLISRHLAYLRSAGIVEARRDGKWMHYSISNQLDDNTHRLLIELFKWMELQGSLNEERAEYEAKFEKSEAPETAKIAKNVSVRQIEENRSVLHPAPIEEPAVERDRYVHHNELEDFLL